MLEGLTQLLELQRLDDQLAAILTEQNSLPGLRERIAADLAGCDAQLAAAKQMLQDAEIALRRAEAALQDQESLLHRLEGQQFQVKSNDAYTALLREMDGARLAISSCETQILEQMEAIEQARGRSSDAEKGVAEARARLGAERRAIDAREPELASEIARLQALRAQLGPQVGRELLGHYERIAHRRRPAVVLVDEERCGGCRVGIPPQRFIEILRCETVVICGNCSRILIHAPKLGSPTPG
ncbi:MAG TPA: C4-type zinc ribbon domain-containing protein [Myxococcota bacterium]|nr:C4-type zinc ribbon domain-containing protein [Myxococcota bacterium]